MCTLLFDLEWSDLKGPLAIFQHTLFGREDFKRLVTTINSAAGDSRLEQTVLRDIDAYLTGRNAAPKPYRWKAKGAAILAKINRARAALDNAKAVV